MTLLWMINFIYLLFVFIGRERKNAFVLFFQDVELILAKSALHNLIFLMSYNFFSPESTFFSSQNCFRYKYLSIDCLKSTFMRLNRPFFNV